jgi:hypothetical protein
LGSQYAIEEFGVEEEKSESDSDWKQQSRNIINKLIK